ncbi:hypothetical protein CBR_g54339 [Chara braunii]|uniref:Starch synthase, chloroplastic/amyloplastic n=1 Tax=Chara braunii TaxID=69332 RepID=A0A388MBY8_CHABU|nr:hypothetical protein CBR_g54339 [Chara braunii]|eukprot:GBG92084.1 hypothetical protein CBR_g54339 [Chara braunii]
MAAAASLSVPAGKLYVAVSGSSISLLRHDSSSSSFVATTGSCQVCPGCCVSPFSSDVDACRPCTIALHGMDAFQGLRSCKRYLKLAGSAPLGGAQSVSSFAEQMKSVTLRGASTSRPSRGVVSCEAGMKIVFVSAEVGADVHAAHLAGYTSSTDMAAAAASLSVPAGKLYVAVSGSSISLLRHDSSSSSFVATTGSCHVCPGCCVSPFSSDVDAGRPCTIALPGMDAFQGLRSCKRYLELAGSPPLGGARSVSSFAELMNSVTLRGASTSRPSRGVVSCEAGMKIVFVSAEVGPWSKTGGLGDVLAGLPPALVARGHRVMTVAPRYDQYRDAWDTSVTADVVVGGRTETVRFFHCHKRGVDRVFVDHPLFLARVWGKTGGKIYGETTGEDYPDNQLRFSLFNQAAIEAVRLLDFKHSSSSSSNSPSPFQGPYGDDVIFVANDWHSALVPCYLKSIYKPRGQFVNAKVAFCVHNVLYQGRFAATDFDLLNLGEELRPSFRFLDGYEKPVVGPKINWMKAGFEEADVLLTVSPNYAKELVSGEDKGMELNHVAERRGIVGIVNGMDVQEWDPASDKYLEVNYDASNVLEVKPGLKELLQAEVGLPVLPHVPLFAFIGRLEEQKGSDVLCAALPKLMQEENALQMVVLGTGKKRFESELKALEKRYPERFRAVCKFNAPLAHLLTAGADFMVIPSRFEPCGLIQLHAMRYGTVPIVSATGGLVDTVTEGVTGFLMGDSSFDVRCDRVVPTDVRKVVDAVCRATEVYGTPEFESMILADMAQDLSWKEPARRWEEALLSLQVVGAQPGVDGEEIAPKALENVATP